MRHSSIVLVCSLDLFLGMLSAYTERRFNVRYPIILRNKQIK